MQHSSEIPPPSIVDAGECRGDFVSHNDSEMSRICSKGLLLETGVSIFQGEIREALVEYGKASRQEAPRRTSIFAEGIFLDVAAASLVDNVLVFDDSLTLDIPYIAQRHSSIA